MTGRIDIWKDDNRNLPSYEVRYFDAKEKLKEAFRAGVFSWNTLYCVGTIHFGKERVNLDSPVTSTDSLSAQRKAYEMAKKFAEGLALTHRIEEIDDATVFRALDEIALKRHRKP